VGGALAFMRVGGVGGARGGVTAMGGGELATNGKERHRNISVQVESKNGKRAAVRQFTNRRSNQPSRIEKVHALCGRDARDPPCQGETGEIIIRLPCELTPLRVPA